MRRSIPQAVGNPLNEYQYKGLLKLQRAIARDVLTTPNSSRRSTVFTFPRLRLQMIAILLVAGSLGYFVFRSVHRVAHVFGALIPTTY